MDSSEPASFVPLRPSQVSSVQFLCPRCEEMFLVAAGTRSGGQEGMSCPHCSLDLGGRGEPPRADAPIQRCWVCGNEEFYIQKDFNRELGLMIVLGSGMIVFLMMLLIDPFLGIACLIGIALVDFIIFRLLASVTVCYLCQSIYRGFPRNPAHEAFYLGSEEKYKKLRQKWLKETLGAPP